MGRQLKTKREAYGADWGECLLKNFRYNLGYRIPGQNMIDNNIDMVVGNSECHKAKPEYCGTDGCKEVVPKTEVVFETAAASFNTTLKCDDEFVRIISFAFGRDNDDLNFCIPKGSAEDGCTSEKLSSSNKTKKLCNGKEECTANDLKRDLNMTKCWSENKYLRVVYVCTANKDGPANPPKTTDEPDNEHEEEGDMVPIIAGAGAVGVVVLILAAVLIYVKKSKNGIRKDPVSKSTPIELQE